MAAQGMSLLPARPPALLPSAPAAPITETRRHVPCERVVRIVEDSIDSRMKSRRRVDERERAVGSW